MSRIYHRTAKRGYIATFTCALLFDGALIVAAPLVEISADHNTRASIERALIYLSASQRADGGWEAFGESHPAITALVVKALAQDDRYGPLHPSVRQGTEYLLRFVQPDGGIYVKDQGMRNYHTCVALMALSAMKDRKHAKTIEKAQQFLIKLQWDGGEGHETSSTWYGGQGYGRNKRPDLSNTQFMLEALHQSGLSPNDPAYKKAMIFVRRCQMLGTTNDQPFAAGSDNGGFVYSPVNGGESKAGTETVDGKPELRSYGSMTYSGFKSMLYANVSRDDPRIQAAIKWIRKHYTLRHNPNMPGAKSREGLYYYYHVFSRAMHAWGEETITDALGVPHVWRRELCEAIVSRQREDGSWLNDEDRWYEGNPHLVTAYAVLAMQAALLE